MRSPIQHARTGWAIALGGLTLACNFDVPSSSYLRQTTLITVMVEVVELGPLNPERVTAPVDSPIAEPMPYDRLRFEAYVVDSDGVRVDSDALDSLWLQCGPFDCGAESVLDPSSELFDVDCEDVEGGWTMDAVCRLGGGDGQFEFELPELGQLMVEQRVAQYYGVIGWEGRSAESCWAARRERVESLDRCGFVQRSVKVGPSWWMLAYAETIGLVSPIPLYEIPAPTYAQQANRVPLVWFVVEVDGAVQGTWPEQDTFTARPGSRIEIATAYDASSQFFQSYFVGGQRDPESTNYLFTVSTEITGERPFSSNAIVWIEPEETPDFLQYLDVGIWRFAVDQYAKPGTSRVLLNYFDERYGEAVANLVFEVQG